MNLFTRTIFILMIGIFLARGDFTLGADILDDRFIAGYASAVLEHDFQLQSSSLVVEHGIVQITTRDLGAADRQRVIAALARIRGVVRVDVVDAAPSTATASLPNQPTETPSGTGVQTNIQPTKPWTLFAPTETFQPLISDPRWPGFSAAYERYVGKNQSLQDAAAVSFGESISIFQSAPKNSGQFELGIQAAVFALFNLDASSKDLVNADYFVGPIAEYRNGDFSGFLRVYHQSSHVGDEFLLNHPGFNRVNLSYEEVDSILSYDLFRRRLRIYGGGGYLFDRDPSDLKPLAVQYGMEFRGDRPFPSIGMIPIAAVDLQNREENHWDLDISARAGVEFEDSASLSRKIDLLTEYYAGHSPNGQFFPEKIQTIGFGLHFYP